MAKKPKGARKAEFPSRESSGYLVRDANRAFQSLLERRIAPFGVTRGQWYFLRVLWNEDRLSQRELSARVGTKESTTVMALRSMEKAGLIRRARTAGDKRRAEVRLTAKGRSLSAMLLPLARRITGEAEVGVTRAEFRIFRDIILRMTANLDQLNR